MKKLTIKTILAATMLFGGILGQMSVSNAAASSTAATTIMTDNFSKYGLEKEVTLPYTMTVGGLSYTLQKVMIFDVNSMEAKSLIKKYDYWNIDSFGKAKYLIWTKIKITNNSRKIAQFNPPADMNYKWRLNTAGPGERGEGLPLSNGVIKHEMNSKESLKYFILKPNTSLETYQAYATMVYPKMFLVNLAYDGENKLFYIAKSAGEN